MNANEMTAIRELTEMNGELRELTVDEENMVAGGSILDWFGVSIRRISSGETCMSVQTDAGLTGFCWW